MHAIAVVGVHGVEDALALGPRAVLVAVHPLARRARVLQLAVGVDHRDHVGDVRDAARCSRSSDARTRCSASTRSVMSRRVGDDAGDRGIVAVVRSRPSRSSAARRRRARNRYRMVSDAPGFARSRSNIAATAGRSSSNSPKSAGDLGIRLRDRGRGTATRSGCDTCTRPPAADDRDHVARVLHERAEPHLALAQRELGALLVAHVGDDDDRRDDAARRVAQRRDRDVHVERPAVAAARSAPRATARSRRRTPARSARASSSADSMNGGGEPIASAAVHPNSSSHAWFHTCTVPAASTAKIGSGDDCTIARSAALAAPARRVDRAAFGDVARQRGEVLVATVRVAVPGHHDRRRDRAGRRPRTSSSPDQRPCSMIAWRISASCSGVVVEELVDLDARQRIVGADADQLARGAVGEQHAPAARVERRRGRWSTRPRAGARTSSSVSSASCAAASASSRAVLESSSGRTSASSAVIEAREPSTRRRRRLPCG